MIESPCKMSRLPANVFESASPSTRGHVPEASAGLDQISTSPPRVVSRGLSASRPRRPVVSRGLSASQPRRPVVSHGLSASSRPRRRRASSDDPRGESAVWRLVPPVPPRVLPRGAPAPHPAARPGVRPLVPLLADLRGICESRHRQDVQDPPPSAKAPSPYAAVSPDVLRDVIVERVALREPRAAGVDVLLQRTSQIAKHDAGPVRGHAIDAPRAPARQPPDRSKMRQDFCSDAQAHQRRRARASRGCTRAAARHSDALGPVSTNSADVACTSQKPPWMPSRAKSWGWE